MAASAQKENTVEGQGHGGAAGYQADQFLEKSLSKTTLPRAVAFAK